MSHFDRQRYPDTAFCVLISTTSAAATRALLDLVPHGRPLVFKLLDVVDRDVVAGRFTLRRATSFLSFTSVAGARFEASAAVDVRPDADEACFPLFAEQGHPRDEVEGYFAAGHARSFAIRRDGRTVAACLTYENVGSVHEVGRARVARPGAAPRRPGTAR